MTVQKELLYTLSFLDFSHVFNLIVSSNEKSILKCRHEQQKKLRNLIPGYKPEIPLDCHDPEKVISIFLLVLCQIPKKVYYVKVLDLLYHLKRLNLQIF